VLEEGEMAVDNDTSGWRELSIEGLESIDGSAVPFRLIANRFKSSSPDCEAFIHDPLGALLAAQEVGELNGFGLEPDWRVATLIVNHHRPLNPTHLYAMATIDADEKTVGVTMVKKIND